MREKILPYGKETVMIEKDTKKISSSFEENTAYMEHRLPVEESFDLIRREMAIGGRRSVFYYIDGFTKDEALLKTSGQAAGRQSRRPRW